MIKPLSIVVIEDHPMMAQATSQLVLGIPGAQVAAIAYSAEQGFAVIEQHQPDLVLLDFRLPDMPGSKVLEKLKTSYPDMKVVVFTGEDVDEMAGELLSLGVNGIISKGTREETIRMMIGCALDDQFVMPHASLSHLSFDARSNAPVIEYNLDEQEQTIMTMIVKGATHEQIAEKLFVSKRSIDNYLRKIYEKLDVSNRLQAIEKFVQSKGSRGV